MEHWNKWQTHGVRCHCSNRRLVSNKRRVSIKHRGFEVQGRLLKVSRQITKFMIYVGVLKLSKNTRI